jgi:hypothetical protein
MFQKKCTHFWFGYIFVYVGFFEKRDPVSKNHFFLFFLKNKHFYKFLKKNTISVLFFILLFFILLIFKNKYVVKIL